MINEFLIESKELLIHRRKRVLSMDSFFVVYLVYSVRLCILTSSDETLYFSVQL